MNDRPTSDIPGDAASNGAPPPFRVPSGAPAGTLARGALDSPPEAVDLVKAADSAAPPPPAAEFAAEESEESEDDWMVLESADGRPLESPYADETALAHALISEDVRNSPAFDYPLEESSGHDFSHLETPLQLPLDAEDAGREAELDAPLSLELDVAHEDLSDHQLATAAGGGAAPPSVPGSTLLEQHDENAPANDREMGLIEHLGELRTRLMWSLGAIILAMTATWHFGRELEKIIIRPARTVMEQMHIKGDFVVLSPTEGFMLQFNIAMVTGVIASMPFLLFQMWRFIEPAMTKRERRFTGIMVPFASVLFFMGCALGYVMSPLFFQFFALFVPPDTLANWSFASTAELLAKMLLVFGVTFQVPVVTIFLNKSGLVKRDVLIEYWRHVVVVIFIVVAIITPTWDPVSLIVCSVPPCLLYALSIWLVKWL